MTCHQVQKGMPCILKQTSQPSIPRQVHRIQHQSPKKAISTPYSLRDQTPLYNRHLLVQKLYLHNELGRLPHRITEVLLPPHGRPLRRAVYGIPSLPAPFRCTKIRQGRLGRRGKTSGQTAGHVSSSPCARRRRVLMRYRFVPGISMLLGWPYLAKVIADGHV